MNLFELKNNVAFEKAAQEMYTLMRRLYPICRSITGNGVRETLGIIKEHIPLAIEEVPTGKAVFDWTIPKEWNISDAYVKDSTGKRVIDFNETNLHVVGYSIPIHTKMTLSELKSHLHALPEHPEWVPYRTTYYTEDWGFCLSQRQLDELKEDETYEVYIDSSLKDGHLTYGEYYLKGKKTDEVLLSCHVCHPSLCNDNLSGIVLVTQLVKLLRQCPLNFSYRILFIPGTIGSITWLALNEERVDRIKHGLVVTGVGDRGKVTYKRTRQGQTEIDRIVEYVLAQSGDPFHVVDFSPYGYDERQYCSPAFDLPVGCLQRTPYGEYPEYHTSADDYDFVRPECLTDSLKKCLSIFEIIENNRFYLNTQPKCEPQLGKRGLYKAIGGNNDARLDQMAMLWTLNLSDGRHDLLDIAEKAGIAFDIIKRTANILVENSLLKAHPRQ